MPGPVKPVCGDHALQVVSHGDALVVLHDRCLHVLPELGRSRVRFRLGVPLFAVAFFVVFVVLFFFAVSEPRDVMMSNLKLDLARSLELCFNMTSINILNLILKDFLVIIGC